LKDLEKESEIVEEDLKKVLLNIGIDY